MKWHNNPYGTLPNCKIIIFFLFLNTYDQCSQLNVKLAMNRLKLQRTKLIEIGHRQRKEIADLLLEYKERVARAKVNPTIFFLID